MRWSLTERPAWASLRGRLTIWNTVVALLMVLACIAAVRFSASAALDREIDAALRGECTEIGLASAAFPSGTAPLVEMLERKSASHGERGWFSQLLTENGETIWRSDRCPDAVAVFPPARKERLENVVQLPGYRYVRHRIKVPGAGPLHVRIGMSTASRDAAVLALTKSLAPAGLALALLTPLAGYWLAVRATRPIAGIVHTAASLRPTRLGDRLAVRGSGDELDQLAETINRLLDQVADHVDRQRQFLADAAHELRGPLAAIRSSLECTVSRERSADEYRTALGDVLEETAHLATLTNDLLLLAEADHEPAAGASATVDLDLLARDAVAMFGAAAEDRGIDLHVVSVPPMVARGDAAQFRRVIGNLLDNAIRFTPAGGRVRVSLSSAGDDGAVLLEIRDTGIGIAPADVPRVFDRFFKADPARTRGGDRGGGLGLPICRAIVERHGGTIAVASEPGRGTTVTVRLHRAGGYAPVETPPRLPTQMAQLAQRAPIQFAGGGTRSP